MAGFRDALSERLPHAQRAIGTGGSPTSGIAGSDSRIPGMPPTSDKALVAIFGRLMRILVDPVVRRDLLHAAGCSVVEDALKVTGQVLARLASSRYGRDDPVGHTCAAIDGAHLIGQEAAMAKAMPPRRRGRRRQLRTLAGQLEGCISDPTLAPLFSRGGQTDLLARMSRVPCTPHRPVAVGQGARGSAVERAALPSRRQPAVGRRQEDAASTAQGGHADRLRPRSCTWQLHPGIGCR